MKIRYPAAALLLISFAAFLAWAFSNWALVNIGIDLKYMGSETDMHLARQAEWIKIRSGAGWTLIISMIILSILLAYRWFFVPSKG